MKRNLLALAFIVACSLNPAERAAAQCSICTKTAQQMGDKPARGLNLSIIYLAATPLVLIGFIGYRWWRHNGQK
jgi:hypothetical protein